VPDELVRRALDDDVPEVGLLPDHPQDRGPPRRAARPSPRARPATWPAEAGPLLRLQQHGLPGTAPILAFVTAVAAPLVETWGHTTQGPLDPATVCSLLARDQTEVVARA